jgi:hypothetical protein
LLRSIPIDRVNTFLDGRHFSSCPFRGRAEFLSQL